MTPLQAMKQALEALERTVDCRHSEYECANVKALVNLRTAIAEMEKAEPVAEVIRYDEWRPSSIVWIGIPSCPTGTKLYPHPQQTIPEGWQWVPNRLNDSMVEVLISRTEQISRGACLLYQDIWQDLLAAAPKPENMP